MTYKKMWETLKAELEKQVECEELTLMYQIEEMYLTKEDVIDELIKEVSKWKILYKYIKIIYML